MASQQNLQLDDITATLLSMGFDFNDCQEAITNGKLTVQAAIDWILAGKPGNVVQPSLKLNAGSSAPLQSSSSNPFVSTNVAGLQGASSVALSEASGVAMGVDTDSSTVISRSHLSQKQQQIKLDFEEKERQEIKRRLYDEKMRKKKDKERILKEIQEDREKQKLTKQTKVAAPSVVTSLQPSPVVASPSETAQTASIQVRLPNGQMFRQTFPPTSTLNIVWDAVYSVIKTAMNAHSGFIQPFPRKEFSREDMKKTLQELGLVPSGSLVLKKKDVQQATASVSAMDTSEEVETTSRRLEEGDEENMEDGGDDMGVRWQGRRALPDVRPDHEQDDGDPGMDLGGEPEEEEAQDDLGLFPIPPPEIPGLAAHPILGNQVNVRGPGHRQQVFEGFGNRLVPEGVPGDDTHLTRRAGEMAAQAAAQRFAQGPPAEAEPAPSSSSAGLLAVQHWHYVTSLQNLSMSTLGRCLTDPRRPFVSLNGLPEELLQTFLAHLMKERILRPKLLLLMPSYLSKLVFDYYPYMTNEMLHTSRVFVHVHTLSLNSCTLITDAGLNSIKSMVALKVINLSGCSQITNHCFSVFSVLPAIQSLILEGTGVTDTGVIQFAYSGACSSLTHLDLGRTAITQEVLPSLQGFKKLRSLYLKQCMITSLAGIEGVRCLETVNLAETHILTDSVLCLTRLPSLSHVSLTGTQFVNGDQALSYLRDLKLTALYLPGRSTTSDVGISYIAGFTLSSLDLTNYTNVGDPSLQYVGMITSLKKLLLTNTKVSDEGIQHLTDLKNLEVLYLDKTRVSNASAAVISCFKHLCELSLSATSITGDFLKQETLNNCTSLTKLNLSRTIIGDKDIVCLSLPHVEMLNLDCTRVHASTIPSIYNKCPSLRSITVANLSAVAEEHAEEH